MSTLAVFLKKVPGWFLWAGIFLPVTVLLLLLITHLCWKLQKTEEELAMAPNPRETVYQLCFGPRYRHRCRAGQKAHT